MREGCLVRRSLQHRVAPVRQPDLVTTPNLPTKIILTKIAWLKLSGRSPMDMRIPPLEIKIFLESSPLKSRIVVRRLAIRALAVLATRADSTADQLFEIRFLGSDGVREDST